MATARIETKEVEVTKTETRRVVVLELSEREAYILKALVGSVNGSYDGPRGSTDNVYHALDIAGIDIPLGRGRDIGYNKTGHPVLQLASEYPEWCPEK